MIYLIDLTMNICNAIQRVKNDNRKFSWVLLGRGVGKDSIGLSVAAQMSVDIFNSFGWAMLTRVFATGSKRPEHAFHTIPLLGALGGAQLVWSSVSRLALLAV